jgi:ATP-binding protein involved in chromosome partitioning
MHTEIDADTTALTADAVTDALRRVPYPGLTRDLVSFGMVEHVDVVNGRVAIRLGVHTRDAARIGALERSIESALQPLGATTVAVELVPPRPNTALPLRAGTPDPWADQVRLSRVRHVIAVGAGKGGVGKSTVAVNVALALESEGLRVALLDADIYGPSLPILLGIEDGASLVRMSPAKTIVPVYAHGLPMISFGFFLGEGSPAIWRGPKVSKAVKQFARGVEWPELDVLVVDLPPGTGDIPVSLAQAVELSGAIVVTQPPRVAAAEARKAAELFRTLEVPVLGVVETMSGPFGRGAGPSVAASLAVPFLGEVPFDEEIVNEGDAGVPTLIARPNGPSAAAFRAIARAVAAALGRADAQGPRRHP